MTEFDKLLAELRGVSERLASVSPTEPFKAAGVAMLLGALIVLAVSAF